MALINPAKPVPPRHVAIIMDGNGRWAKKRGLPRTAGHAAGAEAFRRIANYCRTLGVEYLTVYAFSTENWKRSAEEISGIMRLLTRLQSKKEAVKRSFPFRLQLCTFCLSFICRRSSSEAAKPEEPLLPRYCPM